MAKVVNNKDVFDIEVKRFYMDGFKVISNCPNCSKEIVLDFEMDYLSYPKVNAPFELEMYCDECDNEHMVELLLKMSLEIVENN